MQQRLDSADLRRSALDLIGSGNSPESVSDVLGVPVDRIAAWIRLEADPASAPTGLSAPTDQLAVHGPGILVVEPDEPPARSDAKVGRLVLVVYFGMAAVWLMAGTTMLFINMRTVFSGPPPIESLQRTQGTLSSRAPCKAQRHGGPVQDLVIQSATGTTSVEIPCLVSEAAFQQSRTRDITVFSDDRSLADHEVYEVDFDNVALSSYGDHAARERRTWLR